MIAQIVVFSRKTDAQRKKNFAFRSAKICAKVLRMETLVFISKKLPKTNHGAWFPILGFITIRLKFRALQYFIPYFDKLRSYIILLWADTRCGVISG